MSHISRVSLREGDGAAGVLAKLLTRRDGAYSRHELIWSLFAGRAGAARDFLYREVEGRRPSWIVVSAHPPTDDTGLWRIDTKPYAPALAAGRRLGFVLRANATVTRDGERHDVVMAAMKRDGIGRAEAIETAGGAWLERQGARAGFTLERARLRIGGYVCHRFERPDGKTMVLAALDFEGTLTVTDEVAFARALTGGLGRGKAFGFGLLLVRPAGRAGAGEE
jgi:CRISPR system Cascade subunit CasE